MNILLFHYNRFLYKKQAQPPFAQLGQENATVPPEQLAVWTKASQVYKRTKTITIVNLVWLLVAVLSSIIGGIIAAGAISRSLDINSFEENTTNIAVLTGILIFFWVVYGVINTVTLVFYAIAATAASKINATKTTIWWVAFVVLFFIPFVALLIGWQQSKQMLTTIFARSTTFQAPLTTQQSNEHE